MFSFCINEYVMAEGALFMSNQVTIEDSKINKLKLKLQEKELNLHQMIKDHHKDLLLDADISLWTIPGT